MDNHFDQTMRARAEAEAQHAPARRCFAYGTMLDRAAFAQWSGQHSYDFFALPPGRVAVAEDVTLVFDFPSRFWGGRVASLAPSPGSRVHGLVFDIAGVDWPIIRHKEGALTGMCVEHPVKVRVGGELLDAISFATRPERASTDGPVSARFLEAMVSGARSAGLPAEWIGEIERAK